MLESPEGLIIRLVEKGVQHAKTDVIVNSIPLDLALNRGPLSRALLEKAGPGLQEELNEAGQEIAVTVGTILQTSGYNLNCRLVFHVVLPQWEVNNRARSRFQVATGDITKEVADVIVNSTSNTFNLKSGVSKAILEGAGQNVEAECSLLAQQNKEYIVTEGGFLKCKSIIHVIGGNNVKRSVSCVLEETEQRNYSSICLPAIGTAEIPANWSDMKQKNLLAVSLQPSNPEYNMVASKFNQTCTNFIIENIERIQNRSLWRKYQASKKVMDEKNGHGKNESQLFHGTEARCIPHVNSNGFNRSYAGKNATCYGKGTYFAVKASYSASDTYSKPDANGKKHMYYARVLTGNYTKGNSSLIVPPSRDPQNPTDLYDTVVDNDQNPSIFVVFYDNQAYPEYLITFRCDTSE
ncbi:protein mono-ADP-ribosyltransferase PARP15 [Cricetulus griseus]|uniref:protein mono-ADP-ribosyltransferase PARP15 n=1 Tax=Cricetulus griseus TaxID=10029 RepID=UPI000F747F96|nr:protein mono-ADP-ribosyltransferase PARP15 [Cricetulus griseus]